MLENKETLVTIWNMINTGGVIAVLVLLVGLMIRGDLIPRRTYEDLTKRILKEVIAEIIKGVREVLKETGPWVHKDGT